MLDERPDNAATAETLHTMKAFMLRLNTWYGTSMVVLLFLEV